MRKNVLRIITVTMTLCLSMFLNTNGAAADEVNGNVTQSDLSLMVAMHEAALSFTAQSVATPGMFVDGKNENYLILVQRKEDKDTKKNEDKDKDTDKNKDKCGEAPCMSRAPRAGGLDKAVDGSTCTSGLVCSLPNAACMSNTGKCKTVHLGGGQCACPCVPN